jgi:uncharacterized protein
VAVNGQAQAGIESGKFFTVDREWKPGDRVEIRFPMQLRISTWYHNSVAVERGPLVYSLKIGESWSKLKTTGPSTDWELYPTSPWNYALVLDQNDPAKSIEVRERPIKKQPFSSESAPVELFVKARRLPTWLTVDDSAGPLPQSPVTSKETEQTITLIPYGAAKLRITAFPFVGSEGALPKSN